jgi:tetratricopeptide (TPR) repeat protein
VKRLDDLARRFPDDADDLFGVGKRLLDAERFDLAARAFELSARAGQRPGPSLYDAGCARARAGDVDGAFDTLRRALAAGFDEPELLRDDEDLAAIRGDPRFAELVATAEALALRPSDEAEDWAAASARYAEYTAAHPELGRAWFNLGYARLAADDAAGAVEAFEEALARRYRTATTMYDLACSNARLGRKDEAFAYLFESLHRGLDAEALLTRDHAWKALRADPRFAQALALAKTDRDAAD